jgi:hypothetical protein
MAEDLSLGIQPDENQVTPTLNLAQPKSARAEYLERLTPLQRFGSMLEEFGAGYQGKPSPMEARLETQRKHKLEQLAEGRAAAETIAKGLEFAQRLPPGPGRVNAVNLFKLTLPEHLQGPFEKFASDPISLEGGAVVSEDPRAIPTAHAMCSASGGNYTECMSSFIKDPAKNKMLLGAIDKPILPDIMSKLEKITSMPEVKQHFADMVAKGQFPSIANLRDQNRKLPPELQLSREELLTAGRNQESLTRFGIYTDDMVKDELKQQGRQEAFTFHQGHIPVKDGKDKPINLRTNKKGDVEAEIGDKWVPKPPNVIIGAVKSAGVTVQMPSSTTIVKDQTTGEYGVYRVGKDGNAEFVPMLTAGGKPLKPASDKTGPIDELIAEILKDATDEAKKKSAAEAPIGATPETQKPAYYRGDAPPKGIAKAVRDKDGRWYVERAGAKVYVITVPNK